MPKTIQIIHDYAVAPQKLWDLITDYDALEEVMKGIVSYTGTPSGQLQAGQKMDIEVSLFGKLPKQPYYMEVVSCDHDQMIAQSFERGAGVKSWRHNMRVTPTETGSRLTDTIEIDAGFMTPIFVLWARFLYKARHKPRLRLLGLGE